MIKEKYYFGPSKTLGQNPPLAWVPVIFIISTGTCEYLFTIFIFYPL